MLFQAIKFVIIHYSSSRKLIQRMTAMLIDEETKTWQGEEACRGLHSNSWEPSTANLIPEPMLLTTLLYCLWEKEAWQWLSPPPMPMWENGTWWATGKQWLGREINTHISSSIFVIPSFKLLNSAENFEPVLKVDHPDTFELKFLFAYSANGYFLVIPLNFIISLWFTKHISLCYLFNSHNNPVR